MRSTSDLITGILLVCCLVHVIISSSVESKKQGQNSPTPSVAEDGSQKSAKGGNEKRTPSEPLFDFGLFTVDAYYNETKFKDKLRVGKSFVKLALNDKFNINGSPLTQFKLSRMDELLRCDNLTLIRSGVEHSIDCKPLGAHILDESLADVGQQQQQQTSRSASDRYVRRSSIRMKNKVAILDDLFKDKLVRRDFLLYPLRQDVIEQNIQTILTKNNINEGLTFASNAHQYGFYFEANPAPVVHHHSDPELLLPDWTQIFSVQCSGNIILSVNGTDSIPLMERPADYPQFLRELDLIYNDALDYGYLLSIKDVKCGLLDSMLPFSINNDFTIIQRKEFPYITCKHNMGLEPMAPLWKYEASVYQTRDPNEQNPNAYNTSISITSLSTMLDVLKFKLDQTFAHRDAHTGQEMMTLVHPYLSAIVQGSWSHNALMKSLKLYTMDETTNDFKRSLSDGSINPSTIVSYENLPDSEHVAFTFKLLRNSLNWSKGPTAENMDPADDGLMFSHIEL